METFYCNEHGICWLGSYLIFEDTGLMYVHVYSYNLHKLLA